MAATLNSVNIPQGTLTTAQPVDQLSEILQKVALASDSSDETLSWESILKYIVAQVSDESFKGAENEKLAELLKFLQIWISGQKAIVPTQWEADYSGLDFCNTTLEVQAKVKECLANGWTLRTAGAQHSFFDAVFAPKSEKAVRVKLEGELRSIEWLAEDKVNGTATLRVGAGCNLGVDPSDSKSNESNSLTRTLNARGYALPILGGMSHQTLGGYMSTSTAGGSIDFGCADSVLAIELVDGKGEIRTLDKVANADEFNAAAVSMGLFGVFTHITLTVGKKYLVKGTEKTVLRLDSILSSGASFVEAAKQNNYVHNVWFAAEHVNSVLQFTGNQVTEDADTEVVAYQHPLDSQNMNYGRAATFLATALLTYDNAPHLAAIIFDLIQKMGSGQDFCDHWFKVLPNHDQALLNTLTRVQFTEIWIDIEDSQKVLDTLTNLFQNDAAAAGNFGVEVYPGKQSPYWMSMSYGRDVIRIDPYWWDHNVIGNLDGYFEKFWNALLPFQSARLHWGKHIPAVGKTYGGKSIGPEFIESAYPKFAEWKTLRAQYDPKNIFVTKYWNELLGLTKA